MQRRRVMAVLAVTAAFALTGCSIALTEADGDRAAEAQALYGDLVEGRDDALLARMSSANDLATVKAQLPMIRTLAPSGAAPTPKSLGWRADAGTGGRRYSLSQEYEYPDRFVRADTTFLKEAAGWKVERFNINARMKPEAAAPELLRPALAEKPAA